MSDKIPLRVGNILDLEYVCIPGEKGMNEGEKRF